MVGMAFVKDCRMDCGRTDFSDIGMCRVMMESTVLEGLVLASIMRADLQSTIIIQAF